MSIELESMKEADRLLREAINRLYFDNGVGNRYLPYDIVTQEAFDWLCAAQSHLKDQLHGWLKEEVNDV